MKVGELIKRLKEFDEDLLVVMSIDQEGNSFNPLSSDIEETNYCDHDIFNDDDLMELDDDYEIPDGTVKAIVLWP